MVVAFAFIYHSKPIEYYFSDCIVVELPGTMAYRVIGMQCDTSYRCTSYKVIM